MSKSARYRQQFTPPVKRPGGPVAWELHALVALARDIRGQHWSGRQAPRLRELLTERRALFEIRGVWFGERSAIVAALADIPAPEPAPSRPQRVAHPVRRVFATPDSAPGTRVCDDT